MHIKTLAAALALAAGPAFADDYGPAPATFISSRTRADVQAELKQTRELYRQSVANPWSHNYDPLRTFRSDTTRAEARAAFIAARYERASAHAEAGAQPPQLP